MTRVAPMRAERAVGTGARSATSLLGEQFGAGWAAVAPRLMTLRDRADRMETMGHLARREAGVALPPAALESVRALGVNGFACPFWGVLSFHARHAHS